MDYFVRLGRIYLGLEKGPEDPVATHASPVEPTPTEETPVEIPTEPETIVESPQVQENKNTDPGNTVGNKPSIMSGTGHVNYTQPPGLVNNPQALRWELLAQRMQGTDEEADVREKSDRRAGDSGEIRPHCSPQSGRYVDEDHEEAKTRSGVHPTLAEVTPSIMTFEFE